MHSRALLPPALALGVVPLPAVANAVTTTYTDEASFLAALPGPASTLDFESAPAGTLIPSGSSLGGVTFTYSIFGLSLKVTDAFDATWPSLIGLGRRKKREDDDREGKAREKHAQGQDREVDRSHRLPRETQDVDERQDGL